VLTNDNPESSKERESFQNVNPIPKISAYLRRKSESYLSRHRTDEQRSSPRLASGHRQLQSQGIKEEDPKTLRENNSQYNLVKDAAELL
jgi:hypothetical protein